MATVNLVSSFVGIAIGTWLLFEVIQAYRTHKRIGGGGFTLAIIGATLIALPNLYLIDLAFPGGGAATFQKNGEAISLDANAPREESETESDKDEEDAEDQAAQVPIALTTFLMLLGLAARATMENEMEQVEIKERVEELEFIQESAIQKQILRAMKNAPKIAKVSGQEASTKGERVVSKGDTSQPQTKNTEQTEDSAQDVAQQTRKSKVQENILAPVKSRSSAKTKAKSQTPLSSGRLFDHERDRIREEFKKVCRTFLDVYQVGRDSDIECESDEENFTDACLWAKIDQLERHLELIAPGTGPRYDRDDPVEISLHRIALWAGIEDDPSVCRERERLRIRLRDGE